MIISQEWSSQLVNGESFLDILQQMVLLTALSIHTLSGTGSELETDVNEVTAGPSLHKAMTQFHFRGDGIKTKIKSSIVQGNQLTKNCFRKKN
jgi:hypothetical protein